MLLQQKKLRPVLTLVFAILVCKARPQSVQAKLSLDTASAVEPVPSAKKTKWLLAGNIVAYGGITAGLYSSWYRDYEFKRFHFVDENKKWLQVDKAGHAWSGYIQGRTNIALWRSAGIKDKKAVWIGGMTGFAYMNVIEILDGLSAGWGFSWGDYIADIAGTGLLISQELVWKEQRVLYKFSYSPKKYKEPVLRERASSIYGESFTERLLNDYNGHTYWLSVNLESFFKKTFLPAWLNIAFGYGADGMFGELNNQWTDPDGIHHNRADIKRCRQIYLAPDIDFSRIGTKSKILRTVFFVLNGIKFPAPAIELSGGQTRFHWVGF